ncbi:cation efflux family-domain-containing protein [Obelidium mucronatum]|nr:cation efflux family-domain-containing protein [Obelidium mucronatum]
MDETAVTIDQPDLQQGSQQQQLPSKYEAAFRSALKTRDEIAQLKAQTASRKKGRGVEAYYEKQNHLIEQMRNPTQSEDDDAGLLKVKIAIYGSLAANILLFCLQLFASVTSGSLALFATMADAFMDLTSNSVLIIANVLASRKGNNQKYPAGKKRFETAGIVVFSCIMGALAVELIIEAGKAIAGGESGHTTDLNAFNLSCIGVAVATKTALYFYCHSLAKYPSPRILSQDHRNDILLNLTGIAFSLIGQHVAWWVDPAGGILIASWILYSWGSTAIEHVQKFIGETASPDFLNLVTYLAVTHHPEILQIESVKAYSSGAGYFVEVDIVLDGKTTLEETHNIGETLQEKIEQLEGVERAFVHVDFNAFHAPEHNLGIN